MKTARSFALALLLTASTAWAGAPVPAHLPQTAQWAVHVDMEVVTATEVSKGLMALITGQNSPASEEDIKKINQVWTWLGKVQSVTIYGSGFTPDQPVLLIDGCGKGDGLWFDGGELHEIFSRAQLDEGNKIQALLADMFAGDKKDEG